MRVLKIVGIALGVIVLLIGGAVAASALSLAGAWLAWRRRTSPMARAVRAAHSMRQPGGGA
jgi:hypothetical protein